MFCRAIARPTGQPRGGRSIDGVKRVEARCESAVGWHDAVIASGAAGLTGRHHSWLRTGDELDGVWAGRGPFEQRGPEHGLPGVGAQGESFWLAWELSVPILRISSESAAAASLA